MTAASFPAIAATVRGCTDGQLLASKVRADQMPQQALEDALRHAFSNESHAYQSGLCRALQKALERSIK